MEFNANRVNKANATISAVLSKELIDSKLEKVAVEASKTLDIQGFRKGKVPVKLVKQRYGDRLQQDAQNEAVSELLKDGMKELDIKNEDLVGEPVFKKFDKKEDGSLDLEISIALRPNIELGDYKKFIPEIEEKIATDEKVLERLEEFAKSSAPLTKIPRKRAVRKDDYALIDFEGFLDGVPFEGGKAEKYPLSVGSNSFIPGFEDQVIGMKYEEEKEVTVTFPKEYQAENLAGKEVVFKVKLHEIQQKVSGEINDEFAKEILPKEDKEIENPLEKLKEKIKEDLTNQLVGDYYKNDVKPSFMDNLVKEIKFDLPETVIEQEINLALNNKTNALGAEELDKLTKEEGKLEKMREELRADSEKSVKITFIIDALAKEEKIDVPDQEVANYLYFEAMKMGQNPQEVLKQYQQAGYLPAIKMSMIEEKLMKKLFDEKLGK